jgi:hypothetical protein
MMADLVCSNILLEAMARFLAYTEQPQTIITVNSLFDDTGDALRSLRPTQQVGVDGSIASMILGVSDTPIVFVTVDGAFFVLEHSIDFDASADPYTCHTTTKLGALLLDDRSDPAKVVSELWYRISRSALY